MSIKLTGARELERALKELGKATARNVVRRALTKAAQPMAEAAEAAAPERTGKLKTSIGVSGRAKGANAGAAAFGAALRAGASKAEAREAARAASKGGVTLFMGVDSRVGQGVLQEFGTEHHAAQPFMRPAWDAHKDGALKIIMDELRVEIDKAVARAARKAVRKGSGGRGA